MSSDKAAFAPPMPDDGASPRDGQNAAIADEIVRAGGRPLHPPMSAERERKAREDLFGIGLTPFEQRRHHARNWVQQVRRCRYLPADSGLGPRRPSRSARPRTSHARRRVASSRGDPRPQRG